MKATDPDKLSQQQQWIRDNQDQYDKLVKGMGKAGGGGEGQPAPAGGAPSSDNAPFDADAFIKDALGGK